MKGFGAVLKAELSDLVRHPLVWMGACAIAAACWLFGRHAPFTANGYVVYESALEAGSKIAGFFLLGMAAIAVAGDRARGTVRWILPRPVARFGYVLGKATGLAALALFFLLVAVGFSWLVAQGKGFGDVTPESSRAAEDDDGFRYFEEEVVDPAFAASAMRRRAVLATLSVLPALLTATSLGLLISSLFGSAAAAVMVSIAIALPLNYLPEVVGLSPEASRALPFRAAADYMGQLHQFGRHLATAQWPEYGMTAVLGAVAAAAGLPLLAATAFSRLDLTD